MASTTSSEPKPSRFRAGTVSLHALSSGHFTLPEYQFLHPVARDARKTVPSLAFLIQHQGSTDGKVTRIVFDLGLRRDIERYSEPIRQHVETRRPLTTEPDVVKSLAKGGLTPEDIDYVVYSHVYRLLYLLGHNLTQLSGTLGSYWRATRFSDLYVCRRPWCICAVERRVVVAARRPLIFRRRSSPRGPIH
jgi:hypothetical protein